jgi:hypothetical protein
MDHSVKPVKYILKQVLVLLISLLVVTKGGAQILKKIVNRIKDDAAWRVSNKVDNEIRKGVDSIFEMPKKMKGKNGAKASTEEIDKTSTADNQPKNENTAGNITIAASAEKEMKPTDGFVTLVLSANTIFTGGTILINGESVKYKNLNQVEITVSGPSANDIKNIPLADDGKYMTAWIAADKPGEYTVTVKSSDKKALQSAKLAVYALPDLGNWCDNNIAEINKAFDKLKNSAAKVADGISTKDKAELEKKIADVKDKVDNVLKLYKDLNKAGKETAQLAKSAKRLPHGLAGNLSTLNDNLADQSEQIKALEKIADHEPLDNTVCEYIVILNEACAAFQTVTNLWSRSILTILANIATDKATPAVAGGINDAGVGIEAPYDFPLKEMTKIYATSKVDAESLSTKLGKAGMAADLAQFALDVLLKIYCGVFKGNFTHDYTIQFRNNNGENWWEYGAEMKAVVLLRYPKDKNKGSVIKMKGNLEGNAIKFDFWQDIAKENDFHAVSKGKIVVVPIKTFTPLAVSVATSERDILGFGAIARGLATPAYFNIPIDAEYDVDAKKIKIFVNVAIIDFSNLVANQFVFLMVGQDLIPYPKKMDFPIHKAKTTINGIFIFFKEFNVEKDSKGNESFTGKGTRHIGDKTSIRETNLNFTLTAKKE